MASFRKRGSTWRAEVWANGVRESATFQSKAQATEWAKVREGDLSAKKQGRLPRKTLLDALNEYSREVSPKHRGARWEKLRLAKMGRDMDCAGTLLADLEPAAFARWLSCSEAHRNGRRISVAQMAMPNPEFGN